METRRTWFNEQKNVFIDKLLHEKLTAVCKEYKQTYRRNITIGVVIQLLIESDPIITNIFNKLGF